MIRLITSFVDICMETENYLYPYPFSVISDINSKFAQFVPLTWACPSLPTNNTYCLVSYSKSLYNFVSWPILSVPYQS
jgi:hypothetical protein